MEEAHWILVGVALGLGALLYSSVGHGGASAYIAILGLLGVGTDRIPVLALCFNVVVASIGTVNYYRAGAFRCPLFWPFALASVPMAFVGRLFASQFGTGLKFVLGLVLVAAAFRMCLPQIGIAERKTDNEAKIPPFWIAFVFGIFIGFLSGLASGVSAPFILLNSLSGLLAMPAWGAIATGNFPETMPLPESTILFWAFCVLIGGGIGSFLGSRKFNPVWLKRLLALVLLVAAYKLLIA
jgi:uncharacterized membrane protein YfcA